MYYKTPVTHINDDQYQIYILNAKDNLTLFLHNLLPSFCILHACLVNLFSFHEIWNMFLVFMSDSQSVMDGKGT